MIFVEWVRGLFVRFFDWVFDYRDDRDDQDRRIAELEAETLELQRRILASTLRDGKNRGLYYRN